MKFYPEGILINSEKNQAYINSVEGLKQAKAQNITLEANVMICDSNQNLKLDIPNFETIMLKNDVAVGIKEGKVRDIAIISRVGLPVSFKILEIDEENEKIYVSRRLAQEEVYEKFDLQTGDIIKGRITHLEGFGAFVDIGCGVISLIGIENISVSRITHPSDRFTVFQDIFAVVLEIDGDKINLSHKELLGTWKENADLLSINDTITGKVRSIEPYGMFIELAPNLSGLAEFKEDYSVGDAVSVHIKSINEEKMKIKLNLIGRANNDTRMKIKYFLTEGNIKTFKYSPDSCITKNIVRNFY